MHNQRKIYYISKRITITRKTKLLHLASSLKHLLQRNLQKKDERTLKNKTNRTDVVIITLHTVIETIMT